jgi:hypothetical protein
LVTLAAVVEGLVAEPRVEDVHNCGDRDISMNAEWRELMKTSLLERERERERER